MRHEKTCIAPSLLNVYLSTLLRFLRISLSPSLTLFTHTPFPLTYAFYYIISLNINTEELSPYVAKVVPVKEITDSKLAICQYVI